RAVDPSLSNGVVVSRIARTADVAGTQEQTGNGRVNVARALSDTSAESIQPAGTDPVGIGGPFVGPYRAANSKQLTATFKGSATGQVKITVSSVNTITMNLTPPCISHSSFAS